MHNQRRQPSKNNVFIIFVSIIIAALVYWGMTGFKGLDKLKDTFNKSDKEQTETFDKTPYLGTYYLESIDVEKKDGTTVRYEIGDSYFGELKSTSVTLELQENHYNFISHLGTTVYTMGEWNNDSRHENTFNFENSSGVLAFSAKIIDSTFTRSTTNNGETTTYTLKKA